MAVDTKPKRFSIMGMEAAEAPLLPPAAGAFSQGARQHLLDLYSGILASGAAAPVSVYTPLFVANMGKMMKRG